MEVPRGHRWNVSLIIYCKFGLVREFAFEFVWKNKLYLLLLSLMVQGGANSARTFFQQQFLLKIKVLYGSNFLTFYIPFHCDMQLFNPLCEINACHTKGPRLNSRTGHLGWGHYVVMSCT